MTIDTPAGRVMPVYILADQSYSMSGTPIAVLNDCFVHLKDAAAESPVLSEVIQLCIIGFSDVATTHTELTPLNDEITIPTLTAMSGTSFGAAFSTLESRIPADIAALKASGASVLRPLVFFLTDGQPTDTNWESTLGSLRAIHAHPNILAFGIEKYDGAQLLKIATKEEWALGVAAGTEAGEAVAKFGEALVGSLITSAQNVYQGEPMEVEMPDGFVRIPTETM